MPRQRRTQRGSVLASSVQLENELDAKLRDARIAGRRGDPAEGARAELQIGIALVEVIEQVEHLHAETIGDICRVGQCSRNAPYTTLSPEFAAPPQSTTGSSFAP